MAIVDATTASFFFLLARDGLGMLSSQKEEVDEDSSVAEDVIS